MLIRRKEIRMRIGRDPEHFVLFSLKRIRKSTSGVVDPSFYEEILKKYQYTYSFSKFLLYFRHISGRPEYFIKNVFSVTVYSPRISFSYNLSSFLTNILSLPLFRVLARRNAEGKSLEFFKKYLPLSDSYFKSPLMLIFAKSKSDIFKFLVDKRGIEQKKSRVYESESRALQVSDISRFLHFSVIYNRLKSILRPSIIKVPVLGQSLRIEFLSGQVRRSTHIHFVHSSHKTISEILPTRGVNLFEMYRLMKVLSTLHGSSSKLASIFGQGKATTFKSLMNRIDTERKRSSVYGLISKVPQISGISKFFHSSVIYNKIRSFFEPTINVPMAGRPLQMEFLFGQSKPAAIMHLINSRHRVSEGLPKGEIEISGRYSSAKILNLLSGSSFKSDIKFIFGQRKTDIFKFQVAKNGIEQKRIKIDNTESKALQIPDMSTFVHPSVIYYNRLKSILKPSIIKVPMLGWPSKSLIDRADIEEKSSKTYVSEPRALQISDTAGFFPSYKKIAGGLSRHEINLFEKHRKVLNALPYPSFESDATFKKRNPEAKEKHPQYTTFLDERSYLKQSRMLEKSITTKTIHKDLELEAIKRKNEGILNYRKFEDNKHILKNLDPLHHTPKAKREYTVSEHKHSFPDIVHFSLGKYPNSSYLAQKSKEVKKQEYFDESYKTNVPKRPSVPEINLPGLADRVYDIILERVKREKEMRGR